MGAHLNKAKFHRRWQRQYHRLLKRQDVLLRKSCNQGLPGHIHELRVTLRRLRLMVRVSGPLIDREAAQRYRSWSRQITNATSPLRDSDVTLEWLDTQNADSLLMDTLEARRQHLWKKSRRRFLPPPPEVRSALRRLESSKRGRQRLSRRYPSRFARLHARVVAQIPHFFELDDAGRHAFRRTLRLLRYLRELALTSRQRDRDQLLAALARPQTAMGEFQNVVLANQIIGTLNSAVPPQKLRQALIQEQARWQRQIKSSLRQLARIYRSQVRAGILSRS